MKPTRGRTPTGPHKGEVWQGLAVEHVLTRSVRDSAAMLDATHGGSPNARARSIRRRFCAAAMAAESIWSLNAVRLTILRCGDVFKLQRCWPLASIGNAGPIYSIARWQEAFGGKEFACGVSKQKKNNQTHENPEQILQAA